MSTTRVVVADDSAFVRYTVSHHLSCQPDLEVVGLASNGVEAVEQVEALRPDVVVLDVEMPLMDGLSALRQVMSRRPTPVVMMMNGLAREGAASTVEALVSGAVDFITKPGQLTGVHQVLGELGHKVRQAAGARVRAHRPLRQRALSREGESAGPSEHLVLVGTSGGGPAALGEVIGRLPADLDACVVVVQHMGAPFTRALAEQLDRISLLPVREAAAGDRVERRQVLIVPGGRYLTLTEERELCLTAGPPGGGRRLTLDLALESAAQVFGRRALAAILTGLGRDGLAGARALKERGGRVLAQDEATSVFYEMPGSVVEAGLADEVVPLDLMADTIAEMVKATEPRPGAKGPAG
ncbi:MAG: chemotaxis-specific protein-glutamate methyltransferase CheB [Anaerolineae bacterium]|nr:chemotaxis-specific protein-glutamate methyltransferase CheB [Anaerolineae bacterium]